MSGFIRPLVIHEVLDKNGDVDDIYEAMRHEDMADVVLVMIDKLKKHGKIPQIINEPKCKQKSTFFRNLGNEAYANGEYQDTLLLYNKALLYAPDKSEELTLAYSNRSALLLKTQVYSACLKDIETCFALGCVTSITKKLQKRKEECNKQLWRENYKKNVFKSKFGEEYFRFNVERKKNIPSVSKDVGIIIENDLPKVIAARDIKVGTVVAIEAPFVAHLDKDNYTLSCYYCHLSSMNLSPCKGCVVALFCSKECEEQCHKDYHNIECQVMTALETTYPGSVSRLTIKSALKLKRMCKSWNELITISHSIGIERMKNSSVNEIYDVNNKLSILNFDDDRHFIHGQMYNTSLNCAVAISNLEAIPTFLPHSPNDRKEAIRALARIMMHLYMLFPNKIDIGNSSYDLVSNQVTNEISYNYGWFSFTSKLNHCCDGNILVVGLKNKIALIALHPIKKGSELTFSYIGSWYEHIYVNSLVGNFRQIKLFWLSQRTCQCFVCRDKWNLKSYVTKKLTNQQKIAHRNWLAMKSNLLLINRDEKMFKGTCDAIAEMYTAHNSVEHRQLYKELRNLLNLFQYVATGNVTLN